MGSGERVANFLLRRCAIGTIGGSRQSIDRVDRPIRFSDLSGEEASPRPVPHSLEKRIVTVSSPQIQPTQVVELSPSYVIPAVLVLAAIPLFLVRPWIAGIVALFGLFLMVQAATIRLRFTESDLDVYRSNQLIRRFPYREWLNWRIFWQPVPILFYFREVKSIHFLPILFDPNTLRACLEQRCRCS